MRLTNFRFSKITSFLIILFVFFSVMTIDYSACAEEDTLVIGQGFDIITLDPTQSTQLVNLNLFYNIYDALVTWNPKETGKLIPQLATSWKRIDELTWQFKLRKGVKFHNGEPFNSESVKFTVDRLITKGVHHVYGGFATIEKAEIIDSHTLNIITKKSDPILVNRFAAYGGQIIPPNHIKEVGWKNFGIKPVGTGPYKFLHWIKDDNVTLVANEEYWNGTPKIKKVVWRPIPENMARIAALLEGEIHIATKVIPDHVGIIQKSKNAHVQHTLAATHMGYFINAQNKPLSSKKVRQALNYAIDKKAIIDALYGGFGIAVGSGVPATDFGYNPDIKPYPYDPEKAKTLLKEAGYPDGVDIDIMCGQGLHLNDKQLTEAIATMFREVGINPKIGVLEPAVRGKFIRNQNFPGLMLGDPTSTTFDADGIIWRLRAPGALFDKLWPGTASGKQFHEIMEEARYSLDQEKRKKLYFEANRIWHDEAPELFLFQVENIEGVSNKINYNVRGDYRIYVNDITFRKD